MSSRVCRGGSRGVCPHAHTHTNARTHTHTHTHTHTFSQLSASVFSPFPHVTSSQLKSPPPPIERRLPTSSHPGSASVLRRRITCPHGGTPQNASPIGTHQRSGSGIVNNQTVRDTAQGEPRGTLCRFEGVLQKSGLRSFPPEKTGNFVSFAAEVHAVQCTLNQTWGVAHTTDPDPVSTRTALSIRSSAQPWGKMRGETTLTFASGVKQSGKTKFPILGIMPQCISITSLLSCEENAPRM